MCVCVPVHAPDRVFVCIMCVGAYLHVLRLHDTEHDADLFADFLLGQGRAQHMTKIREEVLPTA